MEKRSGHVVDARRPLFALTKTHFGCTKITFFPKMSSQGSAWPSARAHENKTKNSHLIENREAAVGVQALHLRLHSLPFGHTAYGLVFPFSLPGPWCIAPRR